MADAAYDPTTLIGAVRFYAADTAGVELYTFSDVEITVALGNGQQNAMLAAAIVLEVLAADQARLAMILKNESTSTDMKVTSEQLAARAQYLRDNCGVSGVIIAPDQVFRPSYLCSTGDPGNMEVW
jgi:hypothetical protein